MQTSTGRRLASALAAALSVATITAFAVAPLTQEAIPARLRIIEPVTLNPAPIEADGPFQRQATIVRGESLGSLLRKLGQPDPTLQDFVLRDRVARKLLVLTPGVTVRAQVDGENRILSLTYPMMDGHADDDRPSRLEIALQDGRWEAAIGELTVDRTVESRHATIKTSLFAATDAAGVPDSVAARIPEIFASDMDFHRDVRRGDTLRIVYEVLHDADSIAEGRAGRILAVEYMGQQRKLEAIWFERSDGQGEYYNFAGRRLKKSYLRSPMEFTRISSGFTLGRRHPVFRDWRAHRGVDYAAPIGTKVLTIGDGTAEFVGTQRGYGNVVIIKHDNNRKTLYAHLNHFPPGLETGAKVRKGEVIGFVGRSGWATGAHLHFEFLVDGEPLDPTLVIAPAAAPLDVSDQTRFEVFAEAFMRRLGERDRLQVALFE